MYGITSEMKDTKIALEVRGQGEMSSTSKHF